MGGLLDTAVSKPFLPMDVALTLQVVYVEEDELGAEDPYAAGEDSGSDAGDDLEEDDGEAAEDGDGLDGDLEDDDLEESE